MSCRAGLLATLALIGLSQPIEAAFAPLKEPMPRPEMVVARRTPPPAPATDQQFHLTTETEVVLNGKPSEYKDVPKDAEIVRIDVAGDRKTILRIEFRGKK